MDVSSLIAATIGDASLNNFGLILSSPIVFLYTVSLLVFFICSGVIFLERKIIL